MTKQTIKLKKDKEFSLLKGHPWVYAEACAGMTAGLKTADTVEVYSHKGVFLGSGYADTDSRILIRMIPLEKDETMAQGISRLVKRAISWRLECFTSPDTNAFRLVNGEGDQLPGLIVDKYGKAVSMQIYSLGLAPYVETICKAIREVLPDTRWIWRRNQIRLAKTDSASLEFGRNLPPKIEFYEYGLRFSTDLVNGQKTGFFLDQRENRNLIRQFSKGKSLLNVCGYTGAFTVAAIAGGATSSVTIDIAGPALDEAANNLRLNKQTAPEHQLVCADMYKYLEKCKPQSFDIVVLDPPSMAKNRKDADKAIRAYKRLNLMGVKAVKYGGMLFTASCTAQVNREEFVDTVRDAIAAAGRRAIIVHEAFHSVDHPIAMAHSEGRYLKGLLLRVF